MDKLKNSSNNYKLCVLKGNLVEGKAVWSQTRELRTTPGWRPTEQHQGMFGLLISPTLCSSHTGSQIWNSGLSVIRGDSLQK